ncbi:MAG: polysaccharide pyruvyl transferase family protein [Anaerolineales bacterium]
MNVFHIYANKSNVGDFLSALAIKKLIKIKLQDLYWTARNSEFTTRKLNELNENDIIIIGGGGLLKDYFLSMWEMLIKNYKGNKIVIWGVGECVNKERENTRLPDEVFDSIANIATKIYVRDYQTKLKFERCNAVVDLVGCPSMVLANKWQKTGDRYLLHIVHSQLMRNTILFWREKAIALAANMGLKYIEVNHIFPSNIIKRYLYWIKLQYYYKNSSLILSSRLHGIIIGSTFNVPVIPISNDYKIEAYWKGTLGGTKVLAPNDYDILNDYVKKEKFDPPQKILRRVDELIKLNYHTSLDVINYIKY